jgi:antitoxin (DNA-binding transcriptional repressor) of toxin-antitoxin stability system
VSTVSVQELQADFLGVLGRVQPGDVLEVTANERVVARVTSCRPGPWPSQAGTAKAGCYARPGFWMAPDFGAPLDDFKEYME